MITYQWRRDNTPIPGATSSTYTLVQADEGTVIDCVVTASNNVGSDATETVVSPRLISDNSLIGNYEWNYAWSSNNAAASPGNITAYQGGIDAVNDGNLTYTPNRYTGRLVTADIADTVSDRIDKAIRPTTDGVLTASNVPPPGSTETLHCRMIFRVPEFEEEVSSTFLFEITEQTTGDRYTVYLNSSGLTPTLRFHSQTSGFTGGTDIITEDLDLRNHWVIIDTVLSQTEHWMAINGVQYTDASVVFPGFSGNNLNIEFLNNFDEADDFDFLFSGFRYDDFTFTEHQSDYQSTLLSQPFPALQPEIVGSLTIGSQLEIIATPWEGESPVTFTYQWTRNGVDISGETNSTYVLISTDADSQIGCRITGTNNSSDTFTEDVIAGVPIEGNLFEFDWDHAWAGKNGARVNLIDDVSWDYSWDFSQAPTTPGTVPSHSGSKDLSLISGTYTTGQLTGDLLARAIGSSRVGSSISGSPRFRVDEVYVPHEDVHLRLILERPSASASGFIWWGDLGATDGRDDYIWVSYTHNVDPTLAFFRVELFQDGISIATRDIYNGNTSFVLLDITLTEDTDGTAILSAWGNGGNATNHTLDGPVDSGEPFRGIPSGIGSPGNQLEFNRSSDFNAGLLFIGVRTLINETFDEDDHISAYDSSGLDGTSDTTTPIRSLIPIVRGSTSLDINGTGTDIDIETNTGSLNTVSISSLEDLGVTLDGTVHWQSTDTSLGGLGNRHYRLILQPDWGVTPVLGRIFGAGSTSEENYVVCFVNTSGEFIVQASSTLEVSVPLEVNKWYIIDIVTSEDGPERVLQVFANGLGFTARETGGHGAPSGNVGIGGYEGTSGFIGDLLFAAWREDVLYTINQHYDEYLDSGLFEDIVAEIDWDYAYDFTQAPTTPGNLPELNAGQTLTLTGSYTTGGTTEGLEDDIIGASRVDDALTPGASTSFTATNASFTTGSVNGVHLRIVTELFNDDPSADLFTLGDTTTGSGITITRRNSSLDNIRFTTRTTSGAVNNFDVSTIGVSGWTILDFLIVPDGANTLLQVYINGDLAESTWSQEWFGVNQNTLTINLDNRPKILFLGAKNSI